MNELSQQLPPNPVAGNAVVVPARPGEQLPQGGPAALDDELASDDTMYVDWDVKIEKPPTRPSQTVIMNFVAGGKRIPNIPEEPLD